MAEELRVRGYYSGLYDEGFISTNQCCRLGMEFFISQKLFKGDLSRVVYSKEDIAFRRRIETVGKGDVKGQDYNYINLDLPYAVYSQSGSYEPDDRGSTQNAGQIVMGQMQPDNGVILKAAAVKIAYESTIFFSRRDDVNVASQLLYWEMTPKFPLYYIVEYNLCGVPMDIPVFITLESFDSNVDYAEKEWLEKSKIFPIKCQYTIRSYQTLIEKVDDGIELPVRFSGLYGYNKENEIVYTQKTSLIWSDWKWSPEAAEKTPEKIPQIDSMGNTIYLPTDKATYNYMASNPALGVFDESKVDKKFTYEIVHDVMADVIKGYFEDQRDCVLDEWHQVDEETGENYITIEWKVADDKKEDFRSITIYIPGLVRVEVKDIETTKYKIENLFPGSEYDCSLTVTSKNYSVLTYKLLLNTKGEKVLGKKLKDNLEGKTFQDVYPDNSSITFTGRLADSLIGREFTNIGQDVLLTK